MSEEKQFLRKLAEDYDIPYDDVKWMRENNPDYFNQSLEEYIRDKDDIDFKLKKFGDNE